MSEVLKKPVLVDKAASRSVVGLIEGRKRQLKLGWYVLELENPAADSHVMERSFLQSIRHGTAWKRKERALAYLETVCRRFLPIGFVMIS